MSGIFGKKIPRHPFFVKKEKNLSKFYKKYKKTLAFILKIYYYIYWTNLPFIFVKFGGYHNDF